MIEVANTQGCCCYCCCCWWWRWFSPSWQFGLVVTHWSRST